MCLLSFFSLGTSLACGLVKFISGFGLENFMYESSVI